jgi:tRNA threonylcarbamoyl adenosine modification protein YeaZ
MKKALILETSSERSCIILAEGSVPLSVRHISGGSDLSKNLPLLIPQILKEEKCTLNCLGYLGIGIGPGSYTGLRVGASIIKSFAYALNIPIVGICSLMGYVPENEGHFISIFDAKSGGVYVLEGEKTREKVVYAKEPLLISIEEAQKKFQKVSSIVTPHKDLLKKRFANIEFTDSFLDERRVSEEVFSHYERGDYYDAFSLPLIYLKTL